MNTIIYGINNCDTMKKAMKWLDDHKVDYKFHNYKKDGIDKSVLQQAIDQHGWEIVINRNGTSWRTLPDEVRQSANAQSVIKLAEENPSLIKRPLMERMGHIVIGFDPKIYKELF